MIRDLLLLPFYPDNALPGVYENNRARGAGLYVNCTGSIGDITTPAQIVFIANNLFCYNDVWEDDWPDHITNNYKLMQSDVRIDAGTRVAVYRFNNDFSNYNCSTSATSSNAQNAWNITTGFSFEGNNFDDEICNFYFYDSYHFNPGHTFANRGRSDFSFLAHYNDPVWGLNNYLASAFDDVLAGDGDNLPRVIAGVIDPGAYEIHPTTSTTQGEQTISANTRWVGDVITITGNITVNAGATLFIDANQICFANPYQITVNGKIVCDRSLALPPMLFTAANPATGWKGIILNGTNSVPALDPAFPIDMNNFHTSDFSVFSNCIFEYALKDASRSKQLRNSPSRVASDPTLSGGAIYAYQKNILISNCIFRHNKAVGNGGAVYLQNEPNTTLTNKLYYSNIRNSRFEDNIAGSAGGAIYATYASPYLYDNVITANKAGMQYFNNTPPSPDGLGGGICVEFADLNPNTDTGKKLYITGNEISGNQASGKGGGIYLNSTSNPDFLTNNTLVDNNSVEGKAVFLNQVNEVQAINNIIWDHLNSAQLIGINNIAETLNLYLSHCVIPDTTASIVTNTNVNYRLISSPYYEEPIFTNTAAFNYQFPSYNNYQVCGSALLEGSQHIYYARDINNADIDRTHIQVGAYHNPDVTYSQLTDEELQDSTFALVDANNGPLTYTSVIDFGDVTIGTTSLKELDLRNSGNMFKKIVSIALKPHTGTISRQYILNNNGTANTNLLPFVVSANNQLPFSLSFCPDVFGTFDSDSLVIKYTTYAGGDTLTKVYQVHGKGRSPEIDVPLTTLAFPSQVANNQVIEANRKDIFIQNLGTTDLVMGSGTTTPSIKAPFGFCVQFQGWYSITDLRGELADG
jgi:predicted outer membrane repeat protein